MRQHGMSNACLEIVFKCTALSKLLYAAPSFWGFLSSHQRDRLQAFLRRATKFDYYSPTDPDLCALENHREEKLFNAILTNTNHVLYPHLPALKPTPYNLRPSHHRHQLPRKDDRNFLNRMLYCDMY